LEMQTMFTLVTECTLRAAHICTGSIVSWGVRCTWRWIYIGALV
jgi:hypothetical protein